MKKKVKLLQLKPKDKISNYQTKFPPAVNIISTLVCVLPRLSKQEQNNHQIYPHQISCSRVAHRDPRVSAIKYEIGVQSFINA